MNRLKLFGYLALATSPVWLSLSMSEITTTTLYRNPKSGDRVIFYDCLYNTVTENTGAMCANIFYDTDKDGLLDSCEQATAMKFVGKVTWNTATIKERPDLFTKVNTYYAEFLLRQ